LRGAVGFFTAEANTVRDNIIAGMNALKAAGRQPVIRPSSKAATL